MQVMWAMHTQDAHMASVVSISVCYKYLFFMAKLQQYETVSVSKYTHRIYHSIFPCQ